MITFPKGTLMVRKNGVKAWEKLEDGDNGWWVSLDSNYIVSTTKEEKNPKTGKMETVIVNTLHPESEKPLYKNGVLNRWSFRGTDAQTYEQYVGIMDFILPEDRKNGDSDSEHFAP